MWYALLIKLDILQETNILQQPVESKVHSANIDHLTYAPLPLTSYLFLSRRITLECKVPAEVSPKVPPTKSNLGSVQNRREIKVPISDTPNFKSTGCIFGLSPGGL